MTSAPAPAPPATAPAAALGLTAPAEPRPVELAWEPSPHARRLLTAALAGLVIAVAARRPEFAAAAAPALLLLAGWRQHRPQRIWVGVALSSRQVVEQEPAAVQVTVAGQGGYSFSLRIHPAEAVVAGPGGARPGGARTGGARTGGARSGTARPGDGTAGPPGLPFEATRWGRRRVGVLEIVLRDRWRLSEGRATVPLPRVDVHPQPAQQATRVVLSKLPSRLGERSARSAGEGTEFAGIRDFVPGDRQRRINWPATTRRGSLQLNVFAAERAQDVVVVADLTADVGDPGSTTLDLTLRGAAACAAAHLAVRDRVGFISYHRRVSWIAPSSSRRQFGRIMDAMMAGPAPEADSAGISRLPRAALPPGALVMVFTPLLDPRLAENLRDLRERGFALLVVDVLNTSPGQRTDRLSALAARIWRMEQEAVRFSLRELGVPVVAWDGQQSLDEPLAPFTRRAMVNRR
jgi:uncharacterized protein (DUF58 family)